MKSNTDRTRLNINRLPLRPKLDDVMVITTNDDGYFVCFVSLVKTA